MGEGGEEGVQKVRNLSDIIDEQSLNKTRDDMVIFIIYEKNQKFKIQKYGLGGGPPPPVWKKYIFSFFFADFPKIWTH